MAEKPVYCTRIDSEGEPKAVLFFYCRWLWHEPKRPVGAGLAMPRHFHARREVLRHYGPFP